MDIHTLAERVAHLDGIRSKAIDCERREAVGNALQALHINSRLATIQQILQRRLPQPARQQFANRLLSLHLSMLGCISACLVSEGIGAGSNLDAGIIVHQQTPTDVRETLLRTIVWGHASRWHERVC